MWLSLIFCIWFLVLAIWNYHTLINSENTKFEKYILILLITMNFILAVIDYIKFLGEVLS